MFIDNHVHIGWFSDGYHSPREVWTALQSAGIECATVSSISTCAELYHNIVTEFCQLISLVGKDKIKPILWLSPQMIIKKWPLKFVLRSKIEWRGIKLHFISHPAFYRNRNLVKYSLEIARMLGHLPVLLHTGKWESCHARVFESVIKENPDLTFVLAHGRPIDETLSLMKQYPNTWTDTAFMPIEDLKKLKEEGLTGRTMYGSDAPINKVYYPDLATEAYLKARIEEVKGIAPEILSNCVYDK